MTLSGILTHSGREITLDTGVPSIRDISLALSRIPRFAGHTRKDWTVLEHSLFVEEMAHDYAILSNMDVKQARALRCAALLHDAHEALTGDIPTTFKSAGMRSRQQLLDARIMDELMPGGLAMYQAFEPEVKHFDHRALLAEAVVLHPAISEDNVSEYFGAAPDPADVSRLRVFSSRSWLPANFNFRYALLSSGATR